MRGLQLPAHLRFPDVWKVLGHQVSDLYWLIECASGPFHIADLPEPEYVAAEANLSRLRVGVDAFEDTSTNLFRPQVFPLFAGRLVEDDWSRVYGFAGQEGEAVAAARRCDLLRPSIEAHCLFVRPTHGAWQFFSQDTRLLSLARGAGNVLEIDWNV